MRVRAASDRGFSLMEILVVSATTAVLVSLLLPAVNTCREAARRCSCVNNLRQAQIALNAYNLVHGALPSGTVDPGRPIASVPQGYHHGWIAQILPYFDAEPLYDAFNFTLDAYHAGHQTVRMTRIASLLCPSDRTRPAPNQPAFSSYAGCHHHTEAPIDITNTGMLYLNSAIRPERIPDGLTHTFLLGEKLYEPGDLGWMSGTRAILRNTGVSPNFLNGAFVNGQRLAWNPITLTSPGFVGGYASQHPGGVNAGMADGSTRFIKSTISALVYESFGNRMDHQTFEHSY